MNYSGKFDAKHYADGGLDAHSDAHLHLDSVFGHAPSGAIVVPDAQLLFTGDFKRSGADLILSKDDRELVLQDYFKGEKRAVLASPDGAQLSGDLVNALTGHVEYAQAAGASDAVKIIGHVTKVTGSASALRNGVVITLNEGDNVAKGDVVQTGSDSQLGITFIDGTVFGLSSKARMVLNDMVYDPNGSNNSSLLSLVAGTISFVAGETAKHGDMKVNTPVATMGIRGTFPLTEQPELVEIDFNVPAPGGPVKFQVLAERDGHTGSYILYSLTDPTVEIGRINQSGLVTAVTGLGQITTSPAPPLSPAAIAIIGPVLDQVFQNAPNANPQSHSPPAGSTPSTPPPAAKPGDTSPINNLPVGTPTTVPIPINFQTPDNPNGVTLAIPVTITVLKAVDVTPVVDQANFRIADHVTIVDSQRADTLVPYVAGSGKIVSAVGPADTPAGVNLASLVSIDPQTGTVKYDPTSFDFLQLGEKVTVTVGFDSSAGRDTFHETLVLTIDGTAIHWTNSNGGDFAVAANWAGGHVPGAGDNAVIDAAGTYTVTSAANESVNTLTLSGGTTLDITDGTFTIENGTGAGSNAGLIEVSSTLALNGGRFTGGKIADSGSIEITASATLHGVGVSGDGSIDVGTTATGVILTLDDRTTVTGGTLVFGGSSDTVDVESFGATLDGVNVSGGGSIEVGTTAFGAILTLDDGTTVTGGTLTVAGGSALVLNDATINGSTVNIAGDIDVIGSSTIDGAVLNKGGVTVESGVTLKLDNVTVNGTSFADTASGAVLQIDGGDTLTLNGATISGGTINDFSPPIGSGSIIAGDIDVTGSSAINGGAVLNKGDVTVGDGVTLKLDNVTVNGTSFTDTASGAVLQIDSGDTLTLEQGASVVGGTLSNFDTIFVKTALGATLDGVIVNNSDVIDILATAGGATLTLDDGTTVTGGSLVVASGSTLILNDATIDGGPSGSVIVGDIDVTGSSTIGDGAFIDLGNVTVASGVTLTLDNVTANDTTFSGIDAADGVSGSIIQIDGNDTLTLSGASISNGTLSLASGSTLAIEQGALGSGATLDGVTVSNSGTVQVDGPMAATTTLTLDDGTTISGGRLSIGTAGVLDIEVGPNGPGNPDATLDGVKVTNSGTINVDSTASGAILTLDDGTTIAGGALHIGASGEVYVQNNGAPFGATFDDVAVTNDGSIEIGTPTVAGSTLVLDGGTTISGGTLTLREAGDVVDVETKGPGFDLSKPDATLDGVDVVNNGTIEIGATATGAILALDDTQVVGGTLMVAGGSTLTLNGATISGGTIDDFSPPIGSGSIIAGDIEVAGSSTINGGAVLNNGDVTVGSDATLTLDDVTVNGTNFTDTASGAVLQIDGGHTLVLVDATISGGTINDFSPPIDSGSIIAGDIDVTGSSTINGGAVLNNGDVTVAGDVTLTLDDVTANGMTFTATDAVLQIDGGDTLTLNGATINGGTINIAGDIDITGSSTIDGDAFLNNGDVTVENHVTLTLDDVTVNGTTFTAIANAVFDLQDVTISQAGNGLVINSPDANSSDLINVNIDAASSINVSGGSDGIELTSSGASIAIFDAADITASGSGSVGIFATAKGTNGNVSVDELSNTTVMGDKFGIEAFAQNSSAGDVTVNVSSNATVSAISSFGIFALNTDAGNITVTTSAGDSITSGSAGIAAINEDTSISSSAQSLITVNSSGTIHSGSNLTVIGKPPAGVLAGYLGGPAEPTNFPVPGLFGDVLVNNTANITADAGDGIRAFDEGTGNITINDNSGSITALGGANPTNGFGDGISARNFGGGDISVTTGANTSINSGGSGISAINLGPASTSNSFVSVVADGTIVSGSIPTGNGSVSAGILAGYNFNSSFDADDHGNVIIDDRALITAASGTDGVDGFNFGTGTVTITVEAGAVIAAASGGALRFGINASDPGGGNVSVTNFGSVTGGKDAINAQTTGAGTATIDNHGQLFGDVSANNATFTNELNAEWSLNGTSFFSGTSTLANFGEIESDGNSEIAGLSSFTNSGTIEVESGSLKIDAAVSGAGTATIDAGTTLEFGAGVAAGETVTFGGATGTLILDTPSSFAGKIADISGAGDVLDLRGGFNAATDVVVATTGAGSFNSATGTTSLLVTDTTTKQSVTLTLAGNFSNKTWTVTSDGLGGAEIAEVPPPMVHWINASGGDFAVASNWSPNVVPGSFDDAVIDASGTYTVTSSANVTLDTLSSVAGAALDITGGNFTVTNYTGQGPLILAGGTFDIGSSSANIVSLSQPGGGTQTASGTLTGSGTLTVSGASIFNIGTESGGGITIAQGGATFSGNADNFILDNRTLELFGTSTVIEPAQAILLNDGSSLIIEHGATLTDQSTGGGFSIDHTVGTAGTVTNFGTFIKAGSAPISTVDVAFNDSGTVNVEANKLDFVGAVTGTGTVIIGDKATVEFGSSVSSGQTVTFAGSTGTLELDNPQNFSGEIAITGTGDALVLHGLTKADTTAVTGTGSFNSATDITTLTVTDSLNHQTLTFKLVGDLSASTWTVSNDGNIGVQIVDPPASTTQSVTSATAPTPTVTPVVMPDSAPAAPTQTIVASAPNQTLSGNAASDNFVFNFANVGQTTVADFHPNTDTLQFNSSVFANAQAVLSATQDDGHGNTVIAIDAHDTVTLAGVLKAQLQAADFHFV